MLNKIWEVIKVVACIMLAIIFMLIGCFGALMFVTPNGLWPAIIGAAILIICSICTERIIYFLHKRAK